VKFITTPHIYSGKCMLGGAWFRSEANWSIVINGLNCSIFVVTMEIQLDKIKAYPLFIGLLCVASVASGCLLIYAYNKPLFFALDAFKLTILSVAISLPSICFNGVIAVFTFSIYERLKHLEKTFRNVMVKAEALNLKRQTLQEQVAALLNNSKDPIDRENILRLLEDIENINLIQPQELRTETFNEEKLPNGGQLTERINSSLFFGAMLTVVLLNFTAIVKYILHYQVISALMLLIWNELMFLALVLMLFIYTVIRARKIGTRIGTVYRFGIK